MYLCTVCKKASEPGQARLVHVVKRSDGQIAAELPVCVTCKELLGMGVTYRQLCQQHVKLSEVCRPIPAVAPVVTPVVKTVPLKVKPVAFGVQRV